MRQIIYYILSLCLKLGTHPQEQTKMEFTFYLLLYNTKLYKILLLQYVIIYSHQCYIYQNLNIGFPFICFGAKLLFLAIYLQFGYYGNTPSVRKTTKQRRVLFYCFNPLLIDKITGENGNRPDDRLSRILARGEPGSLIIDMSSQNGNLQIGM